ncbi:hypothetical protein CRE_00754 [Caenorhabditis remanei]|uniref:Uncharacterized protein n=1 Tax=Caenorhabditis remanei TaxID=31234 RepID=E3LE52_CAERE|nr:hypothetical protein CRE_00754 [Caenorhabditis remanei]
MSKEEKSERELQPTHGVVDYASDYRRVVKNESDVIGIFAQLPISEEKREELTKCLQMFSKSFAATWKACNCLVYMEIIESVRADPSKTISVLFDKTSKLMVEDQYDLVSAESSDLLQVANLFIEKYREGADEDALFKSGFGYLSCKLQLVKIKEENNPSILNVAACLAELEEKIIEIYDTLSEMYDFSTVQF